MNIWNRIRSTGIIPVLPFALSLICAMLESKADAPSVWGFLAFLFCVVGIVSTIRSWLSVDAPGLPLFSRRTQTCNALLKNFNETDGAFFDEGEGKYRWEVKTKSGKTIKAFAKRGGCREALFVNGHEVELTCKDQLLLRLFIIECVNKKLANKSSNLAIEMEAIADEIHGVREEYLLGELAKLKESREKGLTEPHSDSNVSDMKQIPNLKVCQ